MANYQGSYKDNIGIIATSTKMISNNSPVSCVRVNPALNRLLNVYRECNFASPFEMSTTTFYFTYDSNALHLPLKLTS